MLTDIYIYVQVCSLGVGVCYLRSKHAETDGLEIKTFAEEMIQFCLEWLECHNNNNTLS